jgi:AraC family transcriptional activator of pobA
VKLGRSIPTSIPSFSLYGERADARLQTDALHIEDIPSRSRKYLWRIATHRHAGKCQCVFVSRGAANAELEGARVAVEGPAAIVIPAAAVHGFRFHADTAGYVLTVDLARLFATAAPPQRASVEALFAAPRLIPLAGHRGIAPRIEPLLERLLEEFRQPDSLIAPVGSWLACSVLWLLANVQPVPSAAAVPIAAARANHADLERLRRFRLLIEANHLRHWPVARYARQLGLSETSLNRLCRRLAAATAFDLIQQRLALEARRRLAYVAGSVAAIGQELGFRDPAYFCRFFRRHNGISPSAFRRRNAE